MSAFKPKYKLRVGTAFFRVDALYVIIHHGYHMWSVTNLSTELHPPNSTLYKPAYYEALARLSKTDKQLCVMINSSNNVGFRI